MADSGFKVSAVGFAADALIALAKAISTGPTPEEIRQALEGKLTEAQKGIDELKNQLAFVDENIKRLQNEANDFNSRSQFRRFSTNKLQNEFGLRFANKRRSESESDLAEHNQQFLNPDAAFEVLADAIKRLDDASLTFEALVQAFGGAVTRIDDASRQLQGAVGELFGPRGEAPGESADGFRRAAFHPPGRFLPAPRSTAGGGRAGGGSISDGLLPAADVAFEDFRDKAKGALGEIDTAAQTTFRRIEGFMVRSLETGKFEWRGLASVAIDALNDILNEQLRASGAASSLFGGGGGGGFAGILGSLFQIGAGVLGPAGGAASSAALSTALSLSGPRFQFAHGGRPPLGKASLVGEAGPELFVPDSLGEIIPNDRLGGAGASMTVNVTQSFDFRGADLAAVAALRREAVRIKREVLAEILTSASRGGVFARMARV